MERSAFNISQRRICMQQDASPHYTAFVKLYLAENKNQKMSNNGYFRHLLNRSLLCFFFSYLSYQLYRYIDPPKSCRVFSVKEFQTSLFLLLQHLHHYFFLYRLSVSLEVYFITGGKQFHPLAPPHSPFNCRESV